MNFRQFLERDDLPKIQQFDNDAQQVCEDKVKRYQSTCQQKWKEKNKDSISEYNKTYFQDWYQKNKEKRLAYNREYVSKNKIKVLEYKREYRLKKQEELKNQILE